MKEVYFFKGGQEVPTWLIGIINKPKLTAGEVQQNTFYNKHASITFEVPCQVTRNFNEERSDVYPLAESQTVLRIKGVRSVTIGKVSNATGAFIHPFKR